MAGSEYTYKLIMDSQSALAAAVQFKTELQTQLAKVPIKVKLDISGVAGQVRGATRGMTDAQTKGMALFRREWDSTMSMYTKHFGQVAPKAVMSQLQGYFRETVDEPAQGAINRLRGVQDQIAKTTHSITRMGVPVEDWMGAGRVERMGMAMQAAQRRAWGVRGAGFQLQGYGRGMMMGAGAALGGAAIAAKQYVDYAEPLGRAARNLELNAQMAELLDEKLLSAAGTMSLFTAEEQAQQLYLWAAATGEVVRTEEELDLVLSRTQDVQKLAALGMVEQGVAVEAVTDIMSQYQLGVGETERIVATLVKVAATSKAEVSDLTMAFRYAGVGADMANTSFSDTAATLQLLSAFGLRGSRAGRGLARLFENLIAPSAEAKKHFDELFETAFGRTDVLQTAEGQFVGLAEAVKILAEATAHLTDMERAEFVARTTTQNASRVLLPLLQLELEGRKRNIDVIAAQGNILDDLAGDHEQAFTDMMQDIFGYEVSQKSAMETLKDQWADYTTSTAGRVRSIKSEFDAAMLSIGKSVMSEAIEPLQKLAEIVNWIGDMAREHPEAVGGAVRSLAYIAGIGALTVAIGKFITLYADVRAVLTAKAFYASAMANVGAAELMDISAKEMMAAALVMQQVPAQMGVAGAAGGAGSRILLSSGAAAAAARATAGAPTGVVAAGAGGRLAGIWAGASKLLGPVGVLLALNSLANAQLEVMQESHGQMTELRSLTGDMLTAAQREALFGAWVPEERKNILAPMGQGAYQGGPYTQGKYGKIYGPEGEVSPEEIRDYLKELGLLEQAYVNLSTTYQDHIREFREGEQVKRRFAPTARDLSMELAKQEGVAAQYGLEMAIAAKKTEALEWQEWQLHRSVTVTREGIWDQAKTLVELGKALGYDTTQLAMFNQEMENLYWLTQQDLGGSLLEQAMMLTSGLEIPSELQLAIQGGKEAEGARGRVWGMSDVWSFERVTKEYETYQQGLKDIYNRAIDEGWAQRRIDYEVEVYNAGHQDELRSFRDMLAEQDRLSKQSVKDREKLLKDAVKGFRDMVGAALKPTDVTWEDVQATELGVYKDKWDEPARQMKAAMYDPASEFHDLIPAEVWAAGPEAAQAFGQRWLDNFYGGMMPDAVNWSAFVEDFKRNLGQQAGKERLVDRAIEELAKEGITATSGDVLAALGLQTPFEQMFFGGMPPTQAGQAVNTSVTTALGQIAFTQDEVESPAKSFTGMISGSINYQMTQVDWGRQMIDAWQTSITNNEEGLKNVGTGIWDGIYGAIKEGAAGSDLVGDIVDEVLEQIRLAYDT